MFNLKDAADFIAKAAAGIGNQATETLDTLKKNLVTERPKNFDDCIAWARNLWQVGLLRRYFVV